MAVQAPADGYTLLYVSSPHAINPGLYRKLPYDTLRDFAPITHAAYLPNLLTLHPSVPARTVKELIAFAKARPNQVSFASGGPGGALNAAADVLSEA